MDALKLNSFSLMMYTLHIMLMEYSEGVSAVEGIQ